MSRKAPAIVLGVTPGIKSLAYVVLDASGERPTSLDHDVLTGGRLKKDSSLAELGKKAYVHGLILSVILERDPPLMVALGPACNPKDPPEHQTVARMVILGLAKRFGVTVVDVSDLDVQQDLSPEPGVSLARVVHKRLLGALGSNDRRIVLAAAVGLVGCSAMVRQRPGSTP
jgi:hypothetical protein